MIAVVLASSLTLWKRRLAFGFFAGYSFLILTETVLIRHSFAGQHFQPELFWSWREWKVQRDQILNNIVMFIPVGVMAGWLWRWKGVWFAVGLSCGIEVLQLVSQRGLCEFDDVFHNCLGAAVGVGIVMLVREIWKKRLLVSKTRVKNIEK